MSRGVVFERADSFAFVGPWLGLLLGLSSCALKSESYHSTASSASVLAKASACVASPEAPALSVTPAKATIPMGGAVSITAKTPSCPLDFEITQGFGHLGADGVFTSTTSGQTVITYKDGSGKTATASIMVLATPSAKPNDPSYGDQYGLPKIDAEKAWGLNQDCSGITVGIVDTGMDLSHPDLAPNLWTNRKETAGNGLDDDSNGYADDIHGWNFVANTNNPGDDNFHGTHVAGIIGAASNNKNGLASVCWRASLAPLKFLDSKGDGSTSDAAEAVIYAARNGFKIVNNSWGGAGDDPILKAAMEDAASQGVLFVTAAGNEGSDNTTAPEFPANYDISTQLSVAATDDKDSLTSFSNYGPTLVHIAAPGAQILSTFPSSITPGMTSMKLTTTGYFKLSGTSMSAPFVTGVAALVWTMNPGLSAADLKARLMNTADALPGLKDKVRGPDANSGWRINAYRALTGH